MVGPSLETFHMESPWYDSAKRLDRNNRMWENIDFDLSSAKALEYMEVQGLDIFLSNYGIL